MRQLVQSRPLISGLIVVLLGLFFAGAGTYLAWLGGSWYYLLAGTGLLCAGALLMMGKRAGLLVYGAVWLGTVLWALSESGFRPWYLLPRLLAPTVLGIYLLMPWVTRKLSGWPPRRATGVVAAGGAVVLLLIIGVAAVTGPQLTAQDPPPLARNAPQPTAALAGEDEWRFYGRTPAGDRFAPQTQITPQNVGQLEVAWIARSGDSADAEEIRHAREFHSEATPLKVGDTLYTCTPHSVVLAIDATTGAVKWRFDPEIDRTGHPYLVCRGVAYDEVTDSDCPHRIYSPTFDARLVALNAETGRPCEGFAERGFINLAANMGDAPRGFVLTTSPPMIVNHRIVIGSRIHDNRAVDEPSGVVRAFDPASGRLIWAWDMGRGEDAIPGGLPAGEVYTRGTPNAWGAFTADPALGLVYLPMGNPTPDYFGVHRRPFDERFGSAIVALEIETGRLRWSFQTVHHDIWDFDLPIGPSLVDLPDGQGSTIPALLQTTKAGQIFLLDRRDGRPVADVEERPTPQAGGVAEDRVAPTQPFSTGMPSFTPAPLTERDAWGATPIDQLLCRIEFRRSRHEGIFTPPGLQQMIGHPAFDGVSDWGGAAIDPERGIMVLNTMTMPFRVRLVPRESPEGQRASAPQKPGDAPLGPMDVQHYPQLGTPYLAAVGPWIGVFGAPCSAPTWGQLSAVDLHTRRLLWQVTLGTSRDSGLFGSQANIPLPTGVPNIGGGTVTRSGLIFIGATTDQYLRAFDLQSGRELWRHRLPAGPQATPMTYTGRDGRQYVVITAGGHGALATRYGDYTIAFALPRGS
ncbi:membrane-bound PQQ-dependent dehydrogenase, glucose/quinate/shikimate family [Plastoroseomonas hellenica]|uniref:membrane-bound PQQ-dependent dehydrogenase, glucose/quinate/shikimate family n=1 Tax=Plastoroseomonas hellenica TaxID=2687306 RepID=UPI001BA96F1E|nr:membrane-bound PQQ-dependent dehydrogenase, glucose/quinate/shikimate family [Plastoroseomonas hellenica]MBR0642256.1 membrane-bound PQQ-dependent dehydrogenase, glucose/quinate/shikimate family [Plastoroseomonas hellenica]